MSVTARAGSALLASNDNWEASQNGTTAAEIAAADRATGAFALGAGSKDAAIVITLLPGAYTPSSKVRTARPAPGS